MLQTALETMKKKESTIVAENTSLKASLRNQESELETLTNEKRQLEVKKERKKERRKKERKRRHSFLRCSFPFFNRQN
jgi:hypothetical protein